MGRNWDASQMAKCPIRIAHDFGSLYATDSYEPARLRGKVGDDGIERPLEWGEEKALVQLPLAANRQGDRIFRSATIFDISQDRNRLAASNSEVVVLFSLPSLKEILTIRHENNVYHISFSPDGRHLLTAVDADGVGLHKEATIKVWDIEAEVKAQIQESPKAQKLSMPSVLENIMNTARSSLMQYADEMGKAEFTHQAEEILRSALEPALDRIEKICKTTGAFHEIIGDFIPKFGSYPWSPDGKHFLSLRHLHTQPPGVNGKIADLIVWDALNWKEIYVLNGHGGPIMWSGYSPDGKLIASSSWDQKVRIWSAKSGELIYTLHDDASNQSWTGRFSPDSSMIAVGNGDGYLRIWETQTGTLKSKLCFQNRSAEGKIHSGWTRGIAWSPNSKIIFAGHDRGLAGVFDIVHGTEIQRFEQEARSDTSLPREVQQVHMSADGNRLAFKLAAAEIVVYDIERNERWSVVQALDPEMREPAHSFMSFGDDKGHLIFSGDLDGKLRVWNLI